jgi:hypothetical protein
VGRAEDGADASTAASPRSFASSLAGACDDVGAALAGVPWLERWPVVVHAAPTLSAGRWVLTDHTGTLPVAGPLDTVPHLVALSGGHRVVVSGEWTAAGVIPLAVFADDGTGFDIGPQGGFNPPRWGGRPA